MKIILDKQKLMKMDKAAHRKVLLESGFYSRPNHKVHKDVKDYTRKMKHKKNFTDF